MAPIEPPPRPIDPAQPAEVVDETTAPDPRVRSRPSRRTTALIAIAVVVALAAGALAAGTLLLPGSAATRLVERYVAAIAAGDAASANEFVAPVVAPGSISLLTDEVLASSTARMTDIEVVEVRRLESDGTPGSTTVTPVEIRYTLSGRPVRTTVRVADDATAEGGSRILDPLVVTSRIRSADTATVQIGPSSVAIGAPDVSAAVITPSAEVVTYPGVYPVTPVDDPLVTIDEAVLVAVAGAAMGDSRTDPEALVLTTRPTPALADAISAGIEAAAAACTAGTVTEGVECAALSPAYGQVVALRMPGIVSFGAGSFTASGGMAFIARSGSGDVRERGIASEGMYRIVDGAVVFVDLRL